MRKSHAHLIMPRIERPSAPPQVRREKLTGDPSGRLLPKLAGVPAVHTPNVQVGTPTTPAPAPPALHARAAPKPSIASRPAVERPRPPRPFDDAPVVANVAGPWQGQHGPPPVDTTGPDVSPITGNFVPKAFQ